tara:strand:+ start:357 stop:584 length:228 start_codon:yes stop_codon:yes gene_type:complete
VDLVVVMQEELHKPQRVEIHLQQPHLKVILVDREVHLLMLHLVVVAELALLEQQQVVHQAVMVEQELQPQLQRVL